MEEYKDLDLTVALFTTLLDRPEFTGLRGRDRAAGLPPRRRSARWRSWPRSPARRVAAGGAPIKVRLVKGANLAMEKVDAELHDWPQAPYTTKAEVDANYVRLLDRAIGGDLVDALRLGVASHHLHHVALAVELAAARGAERQIDVEMLQGMAPAQAQVVARDVREQLVLYTPVVHTRRLRRRRLVPRAPARGERVAGELPLRAVLRRRARPSYDATGSGPRCATATRCRRRRGAPRTRVIRVVEDDSDHSRAQHSVNEPDTDPSLAANRDVGAAGDRRPGAGGARARADRPGRRRRRGRARRGRRVAAIGRPAERAAILREAARALAAARGDLLTVMVDEAGKTIAEADPEISEAIDFAAYYADRAEELERRARSRRTGSSSSPRPGTSRSPSRSAAASPRWPPGRRW